MPEPVKDYGFSSLDKDKLVDAMYSSGGYMAKNFATGVKILKDMIKDPECHVFLSFPAAMVATGMRGIIRDLVKRKMVDTIITTTGTLDHDIARSFGDYQQGSFDMDDKELRRKGYHRIGSVITPAGVYGPGVEEFVQGVLKKAYSEKKDWPLHELIWRMGTELEEGSILYEAHRNKIPVIVPGITDGAVGSQLWSFWEMHRDFSVNLFEDEHLLSDIVFDAKKTGAISLGGGISKHHTIWWNQYRDGLDYALYITTAVEWDGSLSGARTREAISWNKIKEDARHITVMGDATLLFPLMLSMFL